MKMIGTFFVLPALLFVQAARLTAQQIPASELRDAIEN
jgi:hypothetical protein